MNSKEIELVSEEYCSQENSYNICPGGQGGFGYVNSHKEIKLRANQTKSKTLRALFDNDKEYVAEWMTRMHSQEVSRKRVSTFKKRGRGKTTRSFLGKHHSEESKQKIGQANSKNIGPKNSQYGTCWITLNGLNKKVNKKEVDSWLSQGYSLGRVINKHHHNSR